MAKTTIKSSELLTDQPIAWNIYDLDGTLMFAKGVAIDPETKTRILKRGLVREVDVENGDVVTEHIKGAAANLTKEVRLPFSETGVRPGDTVHLVRDIGGTRLLSRLIGYLKNKSIIITIPADEQGSIFLKVGESVVVKVFSGKHILVFPCTVLAVTTNPFTYIHLNYPAEVSGIVVRKSERAHVRIIAAIEIGAEQTSGIITDLSSGGVSIASRSSSIQVGTRVTVNFKVELANCSFIMKPQCIVRAIRSHHSDLLEGATVYGLQFCELSAEDTLILGQFVSQQQAEAKSA